MRPVCRARGIADLLLATRENPRRSGRAGSEARALRRDPFVELCTGVGREEARQKVTAIQLERVFRATVGQGGVERRHVTPHAARIEADGVVAATDDGVGAERAA